MTLTTTLADLVTVLDRIGLRAYLYNTGGGIEVLRVERTRDPLAHGPYCYVSGADGEQPFLTDERDLLLGANYGGTVTEAWVGIGEQDYDLFTTVTGQPEGINAAEVRAAVETMLANADAIVDLLHQVGDTSRDRGMVVAGTALCTRCGTDFGPTPLYGPGTQQTVAHGGDCGGTGRIDPTTLRIDRTHGDAHQNTPTLDRVSLISEHTVFVAFDVVATTRGDAHRQVVDALKFHENGHPTEVSDALKTRGVESWWLIEADTKHYDGNDNAAGRIIFG